MAGRITETKYFEGCLHPITVYHHGEKYSVPCGKCPACLLMKSNHWNFRLSDAIDNVTYSIFFTLTYDNKYLPKIHCRFMNGVYWFDRDERDIRFDGVKDKLRDDDLPFDGFISKRCWPIIQNYDSVDYFGYSSKRDVQLWLKLLRRDIDRTFIETGLYEKEETKLRYYCISEYGPLTFRPHVHGVLFTENGEVCEYLLQSSMYKNWAMCDKSLFEEYTHLCDNGAAGYLSSYLTCSNSLPQILKYREFKPFRLSSKSPALGFESFDREEIREKISVGVIEYFKTISRIDATYVFQYPSSYLRGLFPKCFEYSVLPFNRLYRVYAQLYTEVIGKGKSFYVCSARLRKILRPIDYLCTKRCYEYCVQFNSCPYEYLFLLDVYYYKTSMAALKYWYEWQSEMSCMEILFSYVNLLDFKVDYYHKGDYHKYVLDMFLKGFGIDVLDFLSNDIYSYSYVSPVRQAFEVELDDVLADMVKMKKVNEMSGSAPHVI